MSSVGWAGWFRLADAAVVFGHLGKFNHLMAGVVLAAGDLADRWNLGLITYEEVADHFAAALGAFRLERSWRTCAPVAAI